MRVQNAMEDITEHVFENPLPSFGRYFKWFRIGSFAKRVVTHHATRPLESFFEAVVHFLPACAVLVKPERTGPDFDLAPTTEWSSAIANEPRFKRDALIRFGDFKRGKNKLANKRRRLVGVGSPH